MSGLGEILEENSRLRQEHAAAQARLARLEEALAEREAQCAAVAEELKAEKARGVEQRQKLDAVTARADYLEKMLALIKLKTKGPASERYVSELQADLPFPGGLAPPPRAPRKEDEDGEEQRPASKRGRRRGRPKRRNREDFRHLESQTERYPVEPGTACAACGGELKVIGQAESFRIEWVPGQFVVKDIVRDKCACPSCPDQGVLTVPAPYAIDRGLCGNGLLARVLVDKFADHIPLHRQTRRMAREGFDVGSNTLSQWVLNATELLGVVAGAVGEQLLAGSWLQGDDTGFPVQDRGDGQLRKGRFWAFTDQVQAWYAFTDTKQGKYPAKLLDGFVGDLLLVDGGSEFNQVVHNQGLDRAGCWSHLRSYFFDARHDHPVDADAALGTIRDLFLIERTLDGGSLEQVRAQRDLRSRPLVDGFFEWVHARSTTARPKSKLGEALRYARNQEDAMRVYIDDPRVPMHNNRSEFLLRQVVVGRKNWLFARSEGGAKAAATMYTLIGSCFLQGIDPHEYLTDILAWLPDHPRNRVAELTPAAWRVTRELRTLKRR